MKKYIIMFAAACFFLTGCNSDRSSVSLKSDDKFISYVQKQIDEPCEFVRVTDNSQDYKEYEFLLTDRDITFLASQSIGDAGLSLDNSVFWHDYKYYANCSDYFEAIKQDCEDKIMQLADSYSINIDEYHTICVQDLSDNTLDCLYQFFVDAQEIYDFKSKEYDNHVNYFNIYLLIDDTTNDNGYSYNSVYLGHYSAQSFAKNYKTDKYFRDCVNSTYKNNKQYLDSLP